MVMVVMRLKEVMVMDDGDDWVDHYDDDNG